MGRRWCMFKAIVLCELYNLSDSTKYQYRCFATSLSFMSVALGPEQVLEDKRPATLQDGSCCSTASPVGAGGRDARPLAVDPDLRRPYSWSSRARSPPADRRCPPRSSDAVDRAGCLECQPQQLADVQRRVRSLGKARHPRAGRTSRSKRSQKDTCTRVMDSRSTCFLSPLRAYKNPSVNAWTGRFTQPSGVSRYQVIGRGGARQPGVCDDILGIRHNRRPRRMWADSAYRSAEIEA